MRISGKRSWGALLLGALLVAHAQGATSTYVAQSLQNKFQLIAVENRKVPLVTLVLVCHAGAMTETPEDNGLTHLWEHMFFKGNQKLPDQEAFHRRIRQLGIDYNGDTHAEMVRYFFTLPSSKLEEGMDFMASAIRTPLLDQKEMERERQVVLDEYDRNASNPAFDHWNLERDIIYGDKGFLRDPLGARPLIEKATREQLLAIRDKVFVPANCALIVSGDTDSAQTFALGEKYFGSWQSPEHWQAPGQNDFPPFPAKSIEYVMTRPHVENASLSLTFAGPKVRLSPKDTFAADVLASLLAHANGKFFKKFTDSGLTLGAGFGYQTQWQAGELDVYAETQPEKATAVMAALKEEIPKWASADYFSDTAIEDIRRGIEIHHKRELNAPSHYGRTMAFWWAVTGLDYYDHYLVNLRNTTRADIQAFVTKYLINKPYVGSIFLSPEGAKKANLVDNSAALMAQYGKGIHAAK